MTPHLTRCWQVSAATVIFAGMAISFASPRVAVGILAGGAWNLASLWCLAHLLQAWLGPQRSRRRAIAWLVVKCPVLYGLAYACLRSPQVSVAGFGVGFTLVLVVMLGGFVWGAQRLIATRHGQ